MSLPIDKLLHFIVGVLIYAAMHFIGIGMWAVVIAAVGKEIYDFYHRDVHTPDVMDALATICGGVAGYICAL